ncbi:hypothetical protein AG1IA_05399 [Rhizoctonia solani AG-1 IA]|uniref:Uncharacterized protein n=1 Tax=Thanatephorus cucumeris (strain AG1-IA) TaxID=983506 RepID=L8WUX5_THACA|nr:hypothetical protein AG1IA_05399 [Rhizoctonia solani AG-1 IA]
MESRLGEWWYLRKQSDCTEEDSKRFLRTIFGPNGVSLRVELLGAPDSLFCELGMII